MKKEREEKERRTQGGEVLQTNFKILFTLQTFRLSVGAVENHRDCMRLVRLRCGFSGLWLCVMSE